ncbi:probable UDP-N-acetylglucosamine--peptide N-acetylglucosaminyltransferase SEC [Oryza brachyantha]|uniref:protein O-GlcNAc transferase n=1 Tax=Oryza brachyantha TaxID=4533 RepID=J3L733_ORYBR|nr:probable UDP-N-acetylglucosamine--peptide N-acetylglucosaminyltransferase SEC [Oryza brachyantha]XP_040381179.1 probable UDP-N-acetylglucosamine--peptide N-acetylglucosaminyltransferase SEC [Oryza brachyantha]
MLSARRGGGGGGAAAAAGEDHGAVHCHPPLTPRQSQQLRAVVESLRLDPLEVDEGARLEIARERYRAGDYRAALEHCNAVYRANPRLLENLRLLAAVYYQLREFDMCIAKNEEAVAIQPNFPECFNSIANAWSEKGNVDLAIQFYLHAIQVRPTFADAWTNLANAYTRKGNLSQATECFHQALALNPHLADAYCNLGDVLKAQGLYKEAYSRYLDALNIKPTFANAWNNIAGLLTQWGDFNKAATYYKEAIKCNPAFYDAHMNLGNLYKVIGMRQDAIVCYQNATRARPENAVAYGNLGNAYHEQGQLDLAILNYRQAIHCNSSYVEAYNNLGNALKDAGRSEEAIDCYQTCLALQPSHPQALTNLGNVYMERNMTDIAASFYMATLTVTTGLSAPYNNLAMIYKQQGNCNHAITCFNEVLRIDPMAADCLVNRGNTFKEAGRVTEAIQDYFHAITIRPTMAEAHANLAAAYKDTGLLEAAIISYKQAVQLRQDFPEATCNLLHTLQCVCDWDDRMGKFVEVEGIIRQQIKMSFLPSVQPFHAIAYPIDSTLALEISRAYAAHYSLVASRFGLPTFTHSPPVPTSNDGRTSRLRIGYVSSDFGNHPLSHLMGSVFGMHNQDTIEVFCYALSQDDGTEWRQRIRSEAEHFIDVSSMSSDMIAKVINEDKIQILINLNGYTKGARNEIFALRPAPIQVSYMGFPGTTGADYIDYMVTDEFVSPLNFSHIYSEKLVHLPHCYFVNDYKQKNRDVLDPLCPHKRADYGLPEDKFIFACFNQLYKMDPDIFNTWCNILKRVPNSALWLLRFPAAGEMRLRAYAISKGVRADQIIFTDVAAKNEHIRRSALADLFLDTPLCNGHTTGTDILWAGLPMITLPLQKMATRVAGSLCLATGIGEEMVVNSLEEYEEKAVSLAENPWKLEALRNKLKAVRMTCPLFDTARWVKNLERAYLHMWNLHCSGRNPRHFKVLEDDAQFPIER